MPDILSQAQIDELLKSASGGGDSNIAIEEPKNDKKIKEYDFKAPKKFTKEQIKTLDSVFEGYSRLLSSYITGLMRLYCKVNLVGIEEQRYYEFNNALPDYVIMGMIDMGVNDDDISDVTIIMQLSNPVTYVMIDRLVGGRGEYNNEDRDFTEIEINIMTKIVGNMVGLLKEPWLNYCEISPVLMGIETNSRIVQTIAPDDTVVIVMLDVEINNMSGMVSICLPSMNLEEIVNKYSGRFSRSFKKADIQREQDRKDAILVGVRDTSLDVCAVLGEIQVDLYDILTLQVNDVIPLNKKIDSNIALRIGGKYWFDGKLGIMDGKKAVKIGNILQDWG